MSIATDRDGSGGHLVSGPRAHVGLRRDRTMRRQKWSLLLISLAITLAAPSPASGRAGGGGGGGFGGGGWRGGPAGPPGGSGGIPTGVAIWILLPLFLIVMPAVVFGPDLVKRYARRRARRREASTVQRMRALQPAGLLDFAALDDRVRECFFKVQESWSRRDVNASRGYVSDALYQRHRSQLEAMRRHGRANRVKDVALSDIRVVRLERGTDGKAARFAARIEASARDWVADLRRGVVVGGDPDEERRFVEYWSFSRHPARGWVLDEIRQRDWRLPRLRR